MFFLLRCAFWLGLVFFAMARDAHEDSLNAQAAAIGANLSKRARAACLGAPSGCEAFLERASRVVEAARLDPRASR